MSFHESFKERDNGAKSSEKSFAIVFTVVFLLIAMWPVFYGNEIRLWAFLLAALILGLGLFYPKILTPLNQAWYRLGIILHHIVNPLIMGILFFGIATPTGLIMRLFKGDILKQNWDRQAKTYWIERQDREKISRSFPNQF